MLEALLKPLMFTGYFTASKVGSTGLTVTVDVYEMTSGAVATKIVTAAAATEIGGGLYSYILVAASNDTKGTYTAIFKTTDADVDVQQVPAQWIVGLDWLERVTSTLDVAEGTTVICLDDDLGGLIDWLRIRLNDVEIGNYSTTELKYCINIAKQETEMAAKCHKDTVEISVTAGRIGKIALVPTAGGTAYELGDILTVAVGTGGTVEVVGVSGGVVTALRLLTAGSGYSVGTGIATTGHTTTCTVRIMELEPVLVALTHTYDVSPIFEPTEVTLGDALKKVSLEDVGVSLESWNNTAAGTPTHWMSLTGSSIRIWPTPSAAALGIIGVLSPTPTAAGTGYVVGDVLTISTGGTGATATVTSITSGTGAVTGVELTTRGSGYTAGTAKATTGGTGTNCTLAITSLATLNTHGYARGECLLADEDVPDTIPKGLRLSAILDRAEAEARKMRSTTANNATLHQELMKNWLLWVVQIRDANKGVGR